VSGESAFLVLASPGAVLIALGCFMFYFVLTLDMEDYPLRRRSRRKRRRRK
jgi:hypothetical protein